MILLEINKLFVYLTRLIIMIVGLIILGILTIIETIISTILDLLVENAHHVLYLSILFWLMYHLYGDLIINIWNKLF
jgi:hypothetical protein